MEQEEWEFMHQQPTWIWYPGDFEIWQHLKISLRREERGAPYPAFWKLETFYPSVQFKKELQLERPEKVSLWADGKYAVALDASNNIQPAFRGTFVLPEGRHTLYVLVSNTSSIPAIYLQGETFISDASWEVTCNDMEWAAAGCWNLSDVQNPPSRFRLEEEEIFPVKCETSDDGAFKKRISAALEGFPVCKPPV